MCDGCKIDHEKKTFDRPHAISKVSSDHVVDTCQNFCGCGEGRKVQWFCHDHDLGMCETCKIKWDQWDTRKLHRFTRVYGIQDVREASQPSPARGLGGAAGVKVVLSAPAGPADTDVCSCKQGVVQWFCQECKKNMCDVCEGHHRVTGQWEAHKITKMHGRPPAGKGSRP
jgi:hypothetical protein